MCAVENSVTPIVFKSDSLAISENSNNAKTSEFKQFETSDTEALINCINDNLWSVDTNLKLIAANKAFIRAMESFTGLIIKPGDHLLAKHVFHKDILIFWEGLYNRALLGESFTKEICTPAFNNWKKAWTETSFNPIYKDSVVVGVACYSKNITEKKLAEEELRQSGAHLIQAREVAKMGSWETDYLNMKIICSEETYRIFELDPSLFQASQKEFLEFVHPDDRTKVKNVFENSFDGHSINTVQHRLITASGFVKTVEQRWRIFYDDEGKPAKAVGTCLDITERKNAEEKINNSEEKRRLIMNAALDAIICIDVKGDITFWNPRAEVTFGWTESEALGQALAGLIIPEQYRKRHNEGMALYTKTGEGPALNKLLELSAIKRSGEEFPIELTIMPIKQANEDFFCAFVRDITERKKTEAALKKVYQEKNTLLERIDDGFFAVDENSIVTYWNKKAEILLNAERENVIGKNLHEVFATDTSRAFYNNYQKAIRENTTVHFVEFSTRTNKWFSVSAYASDNGLSVYFKDVTEQKDAEEKLKESELRYRSLIEQATDTICIINTSGKFIEMNSSGCRMFGYSREEILQLSINDVLFEEDLKINPIRFDELKAGKTTSTEQRIKRKDGASVEVELNAKMIEDGRLIVFGRNITERKQTEQRLRQSNDRYDLISKATNDMVWDWDLVTGKVYRNKEGWKKIFRTGDKEIQNESMDDWDKRIHPEDRNIVELVIEEIQKSEKDFLEVECRMLRDDGTYVYIHDRGHIIRNEQGKAIRLIGATQDITARKEAELQVVKSELRFRSLVQNSLDLISIIDEKGYYLYNSPAVKKILGYEPDFMVGKNAFSFIHPDDIFTIKSDLVKEKTGKNFDMTPFRFKNQKGEWRWLESKITIMTDNPEVGGYVFNSRDVTERKIAEEEIKKLSFIARETGNIVIISNPEGEIMWVNEAFTKITEFELEEVIGRRPGDFLQGEDTNLAVVRYMRNKIKNIQPFECDIVNYSRLGRKYWLRIQSQPQFDETGKLKYFFSIETDITKEKEAEEILKASEERYRYLFNNNPASIFIWDIENFQILEVNDTAVGLYGFGREEFLTKTAFDLSLSENHNKIKLLASVASQKSEFRSEVTCKHINKRGEEMYMHISSHLIRFKGCPVILAMATDITDKIILENELENERELKQQEITSAVITAQEKERQELGSELHDNINQILAGSRLYLGLAKKELKAEHPYLTETDNLITSAINEIRNLSHSLIAPSLHESELLAAIENIIEVTQETSGIMISLQALDFDETDIPDKLKLSIFRIIQEQFNNILKHADAQKVIVRLVQENEKTLLSIKDDGVGFDTNKKPNGVGLMNIKIRASLFNGELNMISSPGKGCEMRVLFN